MTDTNAKRILIVDDAPENIDVLTGALTDYRKSIALNGEKALDLLNRAETLPDLILLDIQMPGMDGFEVCKRLKEDERTREIPVIFLTGETDTDSVVRGFELGAADYVIKPFNTSELMARVRTQLALKESKERVAQHSLEIEEKNQMITASINYASRIQEAILPGDDVLSEYLDDYFVMFRPKDIVSGDFYFVREQYGKILVVAADCTGHGVPGAFMSMLGVAFLNEIIGTQHITTPSKILDRLREMVIESLKQNPGNSVKDGMDMVILSYDTSLHVLEFACANNPVYTLRDSELTVVKGDRMPVGFHSRMMPFTNHNMKLQKGDQVYIFSDGFADQFGGPSDHKFKYKPFQELILKHAGLSMKEQQKKYEKAFDDWKDNREQVDDVLMMGVRFNG